MTTPDSGDEPGVWSAPEASNPPSTPPPTPPPPPAAPTEPSPYPPPADTGGYLPPAAGALGKPRSIGISILLAVVTLGIYTFVWVYKTHDEIKRRSGQGLGGLLGLLIYIVISPVTLFLIADETNKMLTRDGRPCRVSAIYGLWFLLPLIGPLIWFIQVQGELNTYWRSLGATG